MRYYNRGVELRNGMAYPGDLVMLISESDYNTYGDACGPGFLIYVDAYSKECDVVFHSVAGMHAYHKKVKPEDICLRNQAAYSETVEGCYPR